MDSQLLLSVFRNVRRGCEYYISRYGDKELPPERNPLSITTPSGASLTIISTGGHHLTYSILEATMKGFLEILIVQGCNCQARIEIFHADLKVGLSNVTYESNTPSAMSKRFMLSNNKLQKGTARDTHPITARRNRQQDYLVPNTSTRLRIVFGGLMDSRVLQRILQRFRSQCDRYIRRGGEQSLPADRDPFVFSTYGADLVVSSVGVAPQLTYSILRNVVQGLLDVLVTGKIYCGAVFSVWEQDVLVADGVVGLSQTTQNVTVSAASDAFA